MNAADNLYRPAATAIPWSTPLNPINAIANSPAVMSAIAIPSMLLGRLIVESCSRMPAKIIMARVKPNDVANA